MMYGRDYFTLHRPEKGDEYFYLVDGRVFTETWKESTEDIIRWKTGNCFDELKNALFQNQKSFVLTSLRYFANANNDEIVWNDLSKKYYLKYRKNLDAIEIVETTFEMVGDIVFSTKEIAEQAIAEIGKENLIKFYFCQEA